MAKFRVLAGKHVEGRTPDGRQRVYKAGDVVDSKSDLNKMNSPGAIKFEKVDDDVQATPYVGPGALPTPQRQQTQKTALEAQLFNPSKTPGLGKPPDQQKGQEQQAEHAPVHPQTQASPLHPLEQMSVKDLVALAQAEEIDLKGTTRKEDIVKTLKAAGL